MSETSCDFTKCCDQTESKHFLEQLCVKSWTCSSGTKWIILLHFSFAV